MTLLKFNIVPGLTETHFKEEAFILKILLFIVLLLH